MEFCVVWKFTYCQTAQRSSERWDGRWTNTATDHMERTKDQRIQRQSSCGWSKVTIYRGLQIHQGKARCVGNNHQVCVALAGQTERHHGLVEHHSASDPNFVAAMGEEHQSSQQISQQPQNNPQGEEHQSSQHISPKQQNILQQETQTASAEPLSCPSENYRQKPKVKWPKASAREEWRNFDNSLCILQNSLRGNITSKLNIFGHVIHEEGRNRFGDMPLKRSAHKQSGR